ncbi:polyhydroxyalkanoic acid synthase subunit PhaR [Bacillus sp. AFS076308]|uniref:polyhydroxyalkanoic acid synthase subunit PhaR n=1 Tax=unclassified Bacillus (in: firmicutes) TaxID=185979 RepID=UPI000BF626FA|nr:MULTISPECIES: polyhydroxyalkanoic acid synthase subunit PhaR [unclassified Bacillus (in: firmicutes)]PFO01435.1 polyhydroxyalkanoic acid synthase subunit PhaR [Bacillus sp. AFS076308]PGV52277.1 polyhydroxyalkanoic acid synthase subunit PhaR [Bacillus sp. AFS037270]
MTTNFNVFEAWKDLYNQTSNLYDEKIMETFPSQGIGQLLDMNLQFKKFLDETTEKYLELGNLPSRKDLANLSSQIVNVDTKVDSLEELLEDKLESTDNQVSFKSELSELKSEMKNLDKKLNQILSILKTKE